MKTNKILSNIFFVSASAVFCTLLWGTAFPCIKIGYELFHIEKSDIFTTLIFAGLRFTIAGVIVLAIGLITFPKKMMLQKRDILPVSVLGFVYTFLQYLLLYIGLVRVSGTRSSILNSLTAFASVILSSLFFKNDRLNFKKALGCVVGITGIVVMNIGTNLGVFTLAGDGLVIISNLSGASGNIISKKISADRNPIQISGWQLIIGGSALTLIGLIFGGKLIFYSSGCVWMLLYLSAMAGIALMIWTMLLFHNDVSRIAVFNLLIPVFGTMWSGLFLNENIFTASNILSLLLVCSGIFLVNFNINKKGCVRNDRNRNDRNNK